MASVRLQNIRKSYDRGRTWAVNGVNLEIADGEFMALLGPSGCGKSSTMRMIAGLEELSEGELYFDDKPMNQVPPQHRNVAMVFETYALYPTLTVYENLAFPMRSAGVRNEEVDRRVRDIVEILQCHDLLQLKPGNLSSGQSQLVGLGRALMRQPNVFIMDEPISHLDTRLRSRMRSYIKRLHIDLGYTMLYVTHDQEEAMALADRIAIMDVGSIVQIGTPQEVFHHPVSTYVAGFIGEPPMNFLDCEVEQVNGTSRLMFHGSPVPLPTAASALAQSQSLPREVTVGIRPFYISGSETADASHTVPSEVFVLEPVGDTVIVSVNANSSRLQLVTTPDRLTARRGEPLWLSLNPDHILLFDRSTGTRLA
ncbi:MAG: ABC transporter ATP-binding protein [Chloroflexi bacterium]|nr:ABC transporter ATP-binding protein [Chloroflexota bacterium]